MNHALGFTAEKARKRLALVRANRFRKRHMLPAFRIRELEAATTRPPLEGTDADWTDLPWNSYWGGPDVHFLLRTSCVRPEGWSGPVALHFPIGSDGDIFNHPEALLYLNGTPIASVDRHHHTIDLPDGADGEIVLHGWTGLFGWPPDPDSREKLFMPPCWIVERNPALEAWLTLAACTLESAEHLDDTRPEKHRMLAALDASLTRLDTRDPLGDALHDSAEPALELLNAGLKQAGPPLDVTLHGIGHAHMDIAYLWPIDQIRLKNARTYSNVLRLMERHPEYRFSHSQPQLYEMTRQDYPAIFDKIRDRVAAGQWEVMGGMWVEPDANMPGGEALVRQILLGRSWFREMFGDVETPVLWLPDTFGFPWSLPQLMKQAGLDYFVTNKLNWNQYNQMPSSTTWWQGIDGSRVLAHCLTTPREVQHLPFPTNYKSDLHAREVAGTWERSTTKQHLSDLPICYGYGDGGGGPTEELIRRASAFGAMPGLPRMRNSTVRDAMQALADKSGGLPTWNGELYLEGHRGTLTSQGWIKRANRKAEAALHEVEALAVMAWRHGAPEATRAKLTEAWRLLCLNQFHDILTGTSVPQVFDDARRDFARIEDVLDDIRQSARSARAGNAAEGAQWIAVNTAPAGTHGPVCLPVQSAVMLQNGHDLICQPVDDGMLVDLPTIPPYGQIALSAQTSPAAQDHPELAGTEGDLHWLENEGLRVEIDAKGDLTRIFDKTAGREVLAPGQTGNQLWAFEDRPLSWDAWDIDCFFEDRGEQIGGITEVGVTETGPLRGAIRITRRYGKSKITQHIRLRAGSARLDFVTEVDWHETHTLLKVAFPVDVHSPTAIYDIQWGEIERPTHRNTSWDFAKFEVPAQKWADLREGGFGVALLNDCKYGYDIRDNVMRLSLIKSATMPDPGADQGRHVFTYALLPHDGTGRAVRAEARRLNQPVTLLSCASDEPAALPAPIVACAQAHVVLETVKPAEDGNGFILRLYEAERRRGEITLEFAWPLASIHRVNLLEEDDGGAVDLDGRKARLSVTPFEIVSLRCVPILATE